MRRLPFLPVLLLSGLVGAGCDIQTSADGHFDIDFASGKATDIWSRSYTVEQGGRFELINVNGRITADTTDGKDVIVEGRRTAKGRSDEAAKEMLAKLEIREEVGGSAVRVESRPPRMSGFGGHEIEWTVKVPKGIVVDFRTTNGGVRLNGLSGEIHAKTTNGGVKGVNLMVDALEASVVNGGVEIELGAPLDATDSVELTTVNGGVQFSLPSESKATIAARAVNGGVRAADELNVTRDDEGDSDREQRRRLNGTMNGGGAKVNVNTTNGGVRLTRAGVPTS
jgi:Putative adhesin